MVRVVLGPARPYYRLTGAGRQALEDFRSEWSRFRDAGDTLVEGPSLAAQIAWAVVFAVCAVGPFFTTAFLVRRMRRPAGTYQPSAGSA